MILTRNYFDDIEPQEYMLAKANREIICALPCVAKTRDVKFDDVDEISCEVPLFMDGQRTLNYDDIVVMKYILLSDGTFYYISKVEIQSEGTDAESKIITATSFEGLLGQKYLNSFYINQYEYGEDDVSPEAAPLDHVKFYQFGDRSKSLLHLVLEKCPEWKIGHVDASLQTTERSFSEEHTDVYSFLMEKVSVAFECFFVFNTVSMTINVYTEDNYGNDTNVYVSYDNLLHSTTMSCDVNGIKTALTVLGQDDIDLRDVNLGQDTIYNFSYYNSTEFWSKGLYDAYNQWQKKYNDNLPEYTSLLNQEQECLTQINYLTNEKMPSDPASTDWSEYGLNPLIEQQSAYEQRQAVLMKAGLQNTEQYRTVYNQLQAIATAITNVTAEINAVENKRDNIITQKNRIADLLDMTNNFTTEQLCELSAFIREDELTSENFVVTDSMSEDERMSMLNEMLKYGQKELAKASIPQMTFSAELSNLFAMPEFDGVSVQFEVGNYIWVSMRDDFLVKPKLLSIHVNYFDASDFSVTFSNVARNPYGLYTTVQDAIRSAVSTATSVSFNKSYWTRNSKEADNISQMLAAGLLDAGNFLSSGTDSEFMLDSRGIFVTNVNGPYAGMDSIFIGGGRILFTSDNWKTVSEAIGRITINGESTFGVLAQAVIAGYIAGSEIVGGKITGSEIIGGSITGTTFNNGNGTFSVDADGNLVASSANITGEIHAKKLFLESDNDDDTNLWSKATGKFATKSEIKQLPHEISMSVDGQLDEHTSASITISLLDDEGNPIDSADGQITMTGEVVFKSNLRDGTTVISGDNIATGLINAQRINTVGLIAENISATTLDSKFLTSSTIVSPVSDDVCYAIDQNGFSLIKNGNTIGRLHMYDTTMFGAAEGVLRYTGPAIFVPSTLASGWLEVTGRAGDDGFESYIDFHGAAYLNDYVARIQTNEGGGFNFSKPTGWTDLNASAFNVQSSRQVKENIVDIADEEADKLLLLRPVEFDYKWGPHGAGMIAEEAGEIFPDAETIPKGYDPDTYVYHGPMDSVPSLDYSKFIPYMIKMLQKHDKLLQNIGEKG